MKLLFLSTAMAAALMSTTSLQGQIFSRIADWETPVPGGGGDETYIDFAAEGAPRVSDRCILFRGEGDMGSQGLYLIRNGTIEVVADLNTPVPGGIAFRSETFAEFEEAFALDDCDVVFDGTGDAEGDAQTRGIYLKREGMPLEVVVDNRTPALGGGTFSDFENPWQEGDRVVFMATTEGGRCTSSSIYETNEDGFSILVDTCGNTPVPGGLPNEAFSEFLETLPILEDGVLTFTAEGDMGTRGIYAEVGGSLEVIADTNTPIPGRSGEVFNQFLGFSPTSGGDIVFVAAGPEETAPFTHAGLYRPALEEGIERILDLLDPPLPGWDPGDPVVDFGFWFCGGDLTTFGAVGTTSPGAIFLLRDDGISRLTTVGNTLDGMTIDQLSRFAFCSRDRIVFVAGFQDGSAIYLVTLPMFQDGFESGDTTAWSQTVP